MCPKGDDPITLNQYNRKIQLDVTTSSLPIGGSIGFQFMGSTAFIMLGSAGSNSNCQVGLQMTGKFSSVNCAHTHVTSYHDTFTIEILQWPLVPAENNLYTNNGNPSIASFHCDITQTNSDTSCIFQDLQATLIKGFLVCIPYVNTVFNHLELL